MNYPDPKKQHSDREYYLFGLRIMSDFGLVIAVPVVLFVLGGQYFDEKYNTYPRYIMVGFVVSAIISALIVWRKAKRHEAEFKALNNNEKTDKNK